MIIGTNGILVDHLGQVLLVQRNDTRTFAPPGGALERGELPTAGIIREMKEETGLIVLPVRLVSLDFWDHGHDGALVFGFRCLLRGGEVTVSEETPHVGFYAPQEFPRPMLAMHRRRLEVAMRHAGGAPSWQRQRRTWGFRALHFLTRQIVYPFLDFKRKAGGQPPYQPPPEWQVTTHTIVSNADGAVLWVKPAGQTAWHLPGGKSLPSMAPWETAVTYTHNLTGCTPQLTNLAAVTVDAGTSSMQLIFTAAGPDLSATETAAYFAAPPQTCAAAHRALLHAARRREETEFLETPPIEP